MVASRVDLEPANQPRLVELLTRVTQTSVRHARGSSVASAHSASSASVCPTSAFAWPCRIPCSALSQFTISVCFAGWRERISFFHSAMGFPYFFSIEGKYEAGPITLDVGEVWRSHAQPTTYRYHHESAEEHNP